MPADVERGPVGQGPVGQGLGVRDSQLHVWMRRVTVVAAHITGLSLTLMISALSRPGTSLFSWHPVCMSVAYWLCITEGLLLFSPKGYFCCCESRKHKVRVHWFCQAMALLSAVVGVGFMVASKRRSELPHLVSWHSVLGVCTLAVTVLQAVCGLSAHFPQQLLHLPHPSKLRLYHTTCGLVVYFMATFTVLSAMFSHWFLASVKGVAWWALFLLPLLSALVVINQILNVHLPHQISY